VKVSELRAHPVDFPQVRKIVQARKAKWLAQSSTVSWLKNVYV
jgi:hypothetical protein